MTFHVSRTTASANASTSTDAGANVNENDRGPSVTVDHPSGNRDTLKRTERTHVLSSSRRQTLLERLLEARGALDVHTLIGWLADAEHEPTVETTIHQLRQRVHISLRRTHLPLLEEYGLVVYDAENELVVPTWRLELYESVLEVSSRSE